MHHVDRALRRRKAVNINYKIFGFTQVTVSIADGLFTYTDNSLVKWLKFAVLKYSMRLNTSCNIFS